MGNRVIEMRTPGSDEVEGYGVYQSTSMAMFTPIFGNQLAAELFALALHDIYPHWDDPYQLRLQREVDNLVCELFTDKPDNHPEYDNTLADQRKVEGLVEELRRRRAAVKS